MLADRGREVVVGVIGFEVDLGLVGVGAGDGAEGVREVVGDRDGEVDFALGESCFGVAGGEHVPLKVVALE